MDLRAEIRSAPIRRLAFSGGGVKGLTQLGACLELHSRGLMDGVESVSGTSVGAINAAAVAMKADPFQLERLATTMDLGALADSTFGLIRNSISLFWRFGWHRGEELTDFLRDLVNQLTGSETTTLGDLDMDLSVVGFNLDRRAVRIFSPASSPGVEIAQALRISASIPLYYRAVKMDGDLWVDGGIGMNYPLRLWDGPGLSPEVLGFTMGSGSPADAEVKIRRVDGFRDYVAALAGVIGDAVTDAHLEPEDWMRTAHLDSLGHGATDFALSMSERMAMITSGRRGCAAHLEWRASFED